MRVTITAIVSAILLSATYVQAEELISATIPVLSQKLGIKMVKGWKTGSHQANAAMFMLELIPPSESINSWTKMLTVNGYKGLASKLSIEEAYKTEANSVVSACPKDAINIVIDLPNSQGYESVSAIIGCSKHPQISGKNEVAFYTFIKGRSDIYMIKKSFRELLNDKTSVGLTKDTYKTLASEVLAVTICKNDGQSPNCMPEKP